MFYVAIPDIKRAIDIHKLKVKSWFILNSFFNIKNNHIIVFRNG